MTNKSDSFARFTSIPATLSLLGALGLATPGCIIEEEPFDTSDETTSTGDGDGDGDASGDGDGDASGDGDGDASGDGDGDASGDGDGDASGDGDGDASGDGDGDASGDGDGDGDPATDTEGGDCIPPEEPIAFIMPEGTLCDVSFMDTELVGSTACYLPDDSVEELPYDGPSLGATLTRAEESTEGAWFFSYLMPIQTFQTHFAFEFRNPGGITDECDGTPGGDGMAFVIHEEVLGEAGGGLGYGGVPGSVAVEFDTWCNAGANNDPSSNHIGIMLDGVTNHADQPTAEIDGNFEDGSTWEAWIEYDGTQLAVFVSNDGVRPDEPNLVGDIDIPAMTGCGAQRVGFTAATGLAYNNAILRSWEFAGQP